MVIEPFSYCWMWSSTSAKSSFMLEVYRRLAARWRDHGDKGVCMPKIKWLSDYLPKEWIGLCALLLSLFLAYITVFRQVDKVSVIFHLPPIVDWMEGDRLVLDPGGESRLIFINSGTRGAVVAAVQMAIIQNGKCANFYGMGNQLNTDFKPIVIKEKEISAVPIKVVSVGTKKIIEPRPDQIEIPVDPAYRSQEYIRIEVCATVQLSTPTENYRKTIAVYDYVVTKDAVYFGDFEGSDWVRPQILVNERELSFF